MELTEKERKFILLNKKPYANRELNLKNTLTHEKEKTWITIYDKLSIKPYLENILFDKSYDESIILNELETLSLSIKN